MATYGSEAQFVKMWISLCELGFLLMPRLDSAIKGGAEGRTEIRWISAKIHNYYVQPLKSPASAAVFPTILADEQIALSAAGIAYLCSLIGFMVNAGFASGGGSAEMHEKLGYKDPHSVLPNNLSPTSHHLVVAARTAQGRD
jgi:hypothetical protein